MFGGSACAVYTVLGLPMYHGPCASLYVKMPGGAQSPVCAWDLPRGGLRNNGKNWQGWARNAALIMHGPGLCFFCSLTEFARAGLVLFQECIDSTCTGRAAERTARLVGHGSSGAAPLYLAPLISDMHVGTACF